METVQKHYRFEIMYATSETETKVYLSEYAVVKETEKGFWIERGSLKKWVSKSSAVRKFAWPTKESALIHFRNRLKKRISWYKYWMRECERAVDITEIMRDGGIDDRHYFTL